jgi:hypothetical protein
MPDPCRDHQPAYGPPGDDPGDDKGVGVTQILGAHDFGVKARHPAARRQADRGLVREKVPSWASLAMERRASRKGYPADAQTSVILCDLGASSALSLFF